MSWFARLRNTARDDRVARDIAREMDFHIAEHAEELQRAGMTEPEALLEARRRFGNQSAQREQTRDVDTLAWLDALRGDLRYALRGMRRSPGVTLVAMTSLALGIGANTAIYSLIDAVMVRSLPAPHAAELVYVNAGPRDTYGYFTNPLWEQIRDRQTALTSVAAFSEHEFDIAERGESRKVPGFFVSGDYFALFGLRPVIGRLPGPGDDVRGCPAMAVLTEPFWRAEFGAADVVGKTLPLEGTPFTIIGVTAGAFTGPEVGAPLRVFIPLCNAPLIRGRDVMEARTRWWLRIMGRRPPETSLAQTSAGLGAIAPAVYAATTPPGWAADNQKEYQSRKLGAADGRTGVSGLRTRYGKALLVLMGAVAIVLLIACANVANLLLARAAARQREVAIRLAIGAGRRRLIRQLLTESALLSVVSTAVALVVARLTTTALVALISTDADQVTLDLSLNPSVLAFAVLLVTLTVVITGVVPALRATEVDPQLALKSQGRGVTEGYARFTLGKALVAGQMALSLVLLMGAGLLVTSLKNLTALDPGFRAEGVVVATVDLRHTGLSPDGLRQARAELLERVRMTPGVRAASTTEMTPASGNTWNEDIVVDGRSATDLTDRLSWYNEVSSGYFATMDIPLLAGRDFDATDIPGSDKTAILSDAAARHYFGAAAAVGRRFRLNSSGDALNEPFTVVGIVANAKYSDLREQETRIMYVPASQNAEPGGWVTVLVRATGDPTALKSSLRAVILALHPNALLQFTLLSHQLSASLRAERLLAVLSGLFSAVALLLSVLGLYGVMSYSVARRRNEIGVRIALGAARSRVVRMVLGDVGRVVAAGLILGLAGAVAAGRLVASFLYGLSPADPIVLITAAAVLGVIALVAGWLPARRAASLEPVSALRED